MTRRTLALLAALVLPVLSVAPGTWAAWRAPVPGPVVARFHRVADPYAAGQRRGIDLAAVPGERVRAPCGGRVAFAGRLPGGRRGVSLRCGALTATVLGLRDLAVRAGSALDAGAPLGTAGGVVRLGARRTAQRHGYVDPETLLRVSGPAGPPPPVGPAARRRQPPGPLPGGAAVPAPLAARAPRILPAAAVPGMEATASPAAAASSSAPLLAWCGLALVAVALPTGALRLRGRRIRRRLQAARQ
jgi:Peptidase family M23